PTFLFHTSTHAPARKLQMPQRVDHRRSARPSNRGRSILQSTRVSRVQSHQPTQKIPGAPAKRASLLRRRAEQSPPAAPVRRGATSPSPAPRPDAFPPAETALAADRTRCSDFLPISRPVISCLAVPLGFLSWWYCCRNQ